jgi:3',5'-cyclic AMP phosphodiesterase CpdA
MAGAGYRDWTAGEKPTAAQFDTYLQEQTIMRFASAAARDAALASVLAEGMFAYLVDTNTLTMYTGSAWSTIGPVHGALLAHTPQLDQGASTNIAKTVTYSKYKRIGREVTWTFQVDITASGSAGSAMTLTLPVTAATSGLVVGNIEFYDTSTTTHNFGGAYLSSTTLLTGMNDSTALDSRFGVFPSVALASGDILRGIATYEAAGDA